MLREIHQGQSDNRPGLTRRAFLLGGTLLGLCSCATVPITGRWQFMLIGQDQEQALGAQAYQRVLGEEPVTRDPQALDPMRRIMARLAAVADRPDYQWEVNVIKDDRTINAFALPGGKIGVYTGIFPIAQTEAGMAIIVGHEVGHVLARHAGERLSQYLGVRVVGTALAIGLGASPHAEMIMAAYGLGARVGVLLPYSRRQELEADQIGLVLAARAGYEPTTALGVWQRMAALPTERPPAFLSTHPDPEDRLKDIEARFLPQALEEFRRHPDPGDRPLPRPEQISGRR